MFRLFQATVEDGKLNLQMEAEGDWNVEAFAGFIGRNLENAGIPFGKVIKQPAGYRDHLFSQSVSKGKTINTTKLPVFV